MHNRTPGQRRDKLKVVDEVWTDERIRSFLDKRPLAPGMNADFSALLFAYRAMRASDFRKFIRYFKAAGRNLDARGDSGETLLQCIASHRRAEPFSQILIEAGAARPDAV